MKMEMFIPKNKIFLLTTGTSGANSLYDLGIFKTLSIVIDLCISEIRLTHYNEENIVELLLSNKFIEKVDEVYEINLTFGKI